MSGLQYQKAERGRRRKALFFTLLFHAALLGGFAVQTQLGDQITELIKDWIPSEDAPKKKVTKKKKPRA